MSKQIVLRATLVGACALMMGLAGCNKSEPASAPPPNAPGTNVPQNVMDQIKNLPPEQRQRAMEQAQKAAGGTSTPTNAESSADSKSGKQ